MKNTLYFLALSIILLSCTDKPKEQKKTENHKAEVKDQGRTIIFPNNPETLRFFETETIKIENLSAEFAAPAQVVASIVSPNVTASGNVVLFSKPDLTFHYTELLNHLAGIHQKEAIIQQRKSIIQQKEAIIQQKQVEVDRFTDLQKNGAATGKDVAEAKTDKLMAESDKNSAISEMATAETELIAEKSAILEHEAELKLAGFNPKEIISTGAGKVWLICDVPESQINKLKTGNTCNIQFSAFPDEKYVGKVEAFGDVVDNLTRMIKMRISLPNRGGKLKSGMFATVNFGVSEGMLLSVPNTSIVTVQGKNYVFVQKDTTQFERKEVLTGQQINDRIIIFSGINAGDKVVEKGAIELKGLSFGY